MNRFLEMWTRFWFPASSAYNLAICRIMVIAAQLIFFFPSLGFHLDLVGDKVEFIEPQLFISILHALLPTNWVFTSQSITMIYWVTAAVGCLALVGFATRVSALVFALGNWFFVALQYSYGEEHHTQAILCIFLLLLALSPSGKRLSVDALLQSLRTDKNALNFDAEIDTAMWPLKLIQVLLAYAYFSTGITKLLYGGFAWMNGYTLQRYMFANAISFDHPLGIWLSQQYALCYILSIATILFEVFFFVSLLCRKVVPWFLISGALFHIGIFVTMSAPFFQHIVLYIVFIDFERYMPAIRGASSASRTSARSPNTMSS